MMPEAKGDQRHRCRTVTSNRDNQKEQPARVESWAVLIALKLIEIYQRYLSPLTPPSCRFYPTCSHYTYEAIARFGLAHGVWLGLKRLCKCQPFHPGGYDPVPELPVVMPPESVLLESVPPAPQMLGQEQGDSATATAKQNLRT